MSQWTDRANYMKKVHRCIRCGKQDAYTLAGKQRCYECVEKEKQRCKEYNERHKEETKKRVKERYERLKSQGICTVCAKRKARSGKVLCLSCAIKCSENTKRYNLRKAEESATDDEK